MSEETLDFDQVFGSYDTERDARMRLGVGDEVIYITPPMLPHHGTAIEATRHDLVCHISYLDHRGEVQPIKIRFARHLGRVDRPGEWQTRLYALDSDLKRTFLAQRQAAYREHAARREVMDRIHLAYDRFRTRARQGRISQLDLKVLDDCLAHVLARSEGA